MNSIQLQEVQTPLHPYERHLACAIVVDRSGSMKGSPIAELNKALKLFGTTMADDSLAQGRVDVTVISFGSDVRTEMGFRSAEEYEAPTLSAAGSTHFNEAINTALDALEARKRQYHNMGITYYRPWLFVLTDGHPTDESLADETRARMQDYIRRNKVIYLPMGIGTADTALLKSYYPSDDPDKPVLTATSGALRDAFRWLSDSLGMTSKSDPNAGSSQTAPIPGTITLKLGTSV